MANVKNLSAKELGALKRTARSEALNELAEKHKEDFLGLMSKYYGKHGLGLYVPEPTAEERAQARKQAALDKAQATIDGLIEQFPELRGQVAPAVVVPDVEEDEVPDLSIDPDIAAAKRGA